MAYPGDLLGDIELLKYLADLSDEISSARFLAQDLKIESKPDLSPVTDADKAVEEKIREVLKAQRPNDKIVGEEFGSAA
ncbi:MAG: histidinol-phosphatase, partial [Actinobacteria bacterium]|nr:histidinol-phosphatase [Actinomycetota bacterium]